MIYFTSDHHFSHQNILKYCNRPFKSIDEMNEEMFRRWNETVGVDDIVYYLGDFSLSIKPLEKYLHLLNGKKYLISGNHDQCHPCHGSRAYRLKEKYIDCGFDLVTPKLELLIKDQWVLMHHMPYKDDKDLRYPEYRPTDKGQWLLHGHVHDKWKIRDRMINVGVDVWNFYPVSIDKIIELIT